MYNFNEMSRKIRRYWDMDHNIHTYKLKGDIESDIKILFLNIGT
jgi:hypothetical protein